MTTSRRHQVKRAIEAGSFFPLGATVQPEGVNFAIYSRDASEVHLLLFDRTDGPPTDVIQVANRTKFVWHTFVAGVKPGQLYGYKVLGDFDPAAGKRFNGAKLLIDPYAKALSHKASNRDNLLLAYDSTSADRDLSLDTRDGRCAPALPCAVVVDTLLQNAIGKLRENALGRGAGANRVDRWRGCGGAVGPGRTCLCRGPDGITPGGPDVAPSRARKGGGRDRRERHAVAGKQHTAWHAGLLWRTSADGQEFARDSAPELFYC